MAIGIKVSKKDVDVKAAGINDLSIDSTMPALKVFQSGSGVVQANGSSGSVVIPHDLGYIPIFVVYMEESPNSQRRYMVTTVSPAEPTAVDSPAWKAEIDAVNLTISSAALRRMQQRFRESQ